MIEPRLSRFALGTFIAWLAVTAGWWILAFAPLPVAEEWLAEARAICFGTLENGLPDTWGWILLILGPLSMLGFLVAVWGRELAETGAWLARRRLGAASLVLLVVGLVWGGALIGSRVAAAMRLGAPIWAASEEPLPAGYPRIREEIPDFALVDQYGESVTAESLRGRATIVTFAYAHCTTVCPVVVDTSRRAARKSRHEPAVVVFSLDPWRDTPRSLPGLARTWQLDTLPGARLLTGDVDAVLAAVEGFHVPMDRNPQTGEISHPALIYVLDHEGKLAYRFLNPPPAWLVEALERLRREV
jgi:protein SCO1